MCGIVYVHSDQNKPVNDGILNLFDAQRHRGTQGFGLFDGQEKNIVRATTEDKILDWLCRYDSNLILFHHRLPTSTANVKSAAHPFATKDFFGKHQYILVHNGHIHNASELKIAHQALGIEYNSVQPDKSFNDSESLLWDVALYLEGKQAELKARGRMAWICIRLKDGELDKLYFGRNVNPLNMLRVPKVGIALSSEGAGQEIEDNVLYTYNYKLKRLTTKALIMPEYQRTTWDYPPAQQPSTPWWHHDYKEDEDWEEDTYDTYDDMNDDWVISAHVAPREIEETLMFYLLRNQGSFQKAHDELEEDYSQIAEDCRTPEEFHQMCVYEAAESELWADTEWKDRNSISSKYTARKQLALMQVG